MSPKKRFTIKRLSIGIGLVAVLGIFTQAQKADTYFEISKNLEIFINTFKELQTFYVDPIEPGKLVKTGINSMLAELDPYTNYITESDIEEFEFQTTGKYGGIGASMRKKGDDILIGEVYENSPARKAGLQAGDYVLSIDDNVVAGKNIEDITMLLKGAPGTRLQIKIKQAYSGEVIEKTLIREEIEISSVPYASLIGSDKSIAYVKLTQFTHGCSRTVKAKLDSLKKINPALSGVVLDLRNNPGGLLDEAVNLCNLFLNRGQLVVFTKGKIPEMDKDYNTMSQAWDTLIPVTVLINRSSASASEIVSGTLQDLDRGVVIGERSYGKGLVQMTRNLGYNAKLKLTTAKYYTPSGRCIQAIDYAHRNPDGSVGEIPDSLKKTYFTKGGRKVKSGGGVEPDITVTNDPVSKLAIVLYNKSYLFDFATQYAGEHKQIDKPETFSLSEEAFSKFVAYLDNKDYAYKTETEILLDSLKAVASREDYFSMIKDDYAGLQRKVMHDKKQDLLKHKEEVKRLLESEIVSRYYFFPGRIAHGMRSDKDVLEAIRILEQPQTYHAMLQKK